MEGALFFSFWFIGASVVSIMASHYGKSGFLWFLVALIISPVLALVLVLALKDAGAQKVVTVVEHVKKCPMCAELVKFEANKCKHCGHMF